MVTKYSVYTGAVNVKNQEEVVGLYEDDLSYIIRNLNLDCLVSAPFIEVYLGIKRLVGM